MNNTLMLDCSAGMNIVLETENGVFKKIDNNQKRHSDELLLSVDNLLSEAKILIKDVKNICVCTGPGSFTGIRVAASICKGLSIGTGANVFTATNFDIFSYGDTNNSVYILDGFSTFVYVRIIENGKISDSCEQFLDVVNLLKEKKGYNVFVQSENLMTKLKENDVQCKFAVNKMIDCFNDKIENNQSIDLNKIEPIYLRASQAEIERNQKLKEQK